MANSFHSPLKALSVLFTPPQKELHFSPEMEFFLMKRRLLRLENASILTKIQKYWLDQSFVAVICNMYKETGGRGKI